MLELFQQCGVIQRILLHQSATKPFDTQTIVQLIGPAGKNELGYARPQGKCNRTNATVMHQSTCPR